MTRVEDCTVLGHNYTCHIADYAAMLIVFDLKGIPEDSLQDKIHIESNFSYAVQYLTVKSVKALVTWT